VPIKFVAPKLLNLIELETPKTMHQWFQSIHTVHGYCL
jgi:hypothetical protein